MGVYFALLEYGDKVLGMDLSQGGHLTHGSPVNISGKYFNFIAYGVDKETEQIDYEKPQRNRTCRKAKDDSCRRERIFKRDRFQAYR